MFDKLSALFSPSSKETPTFTQEDRRHFSQQYLQQEYQTDGIYCEGASGGVVTIRVTSPTLQEAVHLSQWDLEQKLAQHMQFDLKKLVVIR